MSDTDLAFRATLDGSGFASGAQQLTGHLNTLGIQTNTATANLGGLGTILGTMANPATAAALAITAVGAGLATSVNVAAGFQQKMAGVSAIMYDSTKSSAENAQMLKDLESAAREAGATTQFSASQAADALGFMAGAGWNASQATTALKDTLTLSAAGGMDLAAAGDLMTGTVSQFGLAATDSARVANVLAAGASATNTNVSELGAGMKVVGSTANAFGMSLESTTAALGQLSNGNIKGAEGGTALRGVLASLATQSGPAASALAELGLTTADVNPETVSLADSMTLLQERGMTATQAIAIFGRENVSAATYMAAHASELDGLQTSITGTSKASEMAAIQTATYQGAMGELSSAVEEAEIALGSVLLPVVTETVQLFTAGVTATTDFGKAIYDAFEPSGSVGSVFAESDKWLADTFGFPAGEQAAAGIAEGITDNKDLQTATGDALGSDASKAAVAKSADELAKEFTKQYGSQFEAGMTLINGKWTSQAAAVADKISEQTVQYNDQEYILRSINSGENMIYEIRSKSTGELIRQSEQMRQTNALLTDMQWASQYGYEAISRTITFDFIVNKTTALDSAFTELGDSAANAMKNGIIEATEQQTLTELAAKFVAMGGDASDALISAIQRKDWGAVGRMMGTKIGDGLKDALTGTVRTINEKPLEEILKGDLSEIENYPAWVENTFSPALKTSFDEMYDVFKTGYGQDIQQGIEWVNEKEAIYLAHSDWFADWQQDILAKHVQGQLTEIEAIEAWHAYEDEAAKKAEEKQDDAVTSAGMFYGELVDQAAKWTDFINGEGGFVGPTALYDDYRAATDPNKALSAEINAAYNVGTIGSITAIEQAVTIDTSSGPLPVRIESIAPGASTGQSTGTTASDGNVLDQTQNVSNSTSISIAINSGVRDITNTIKTQGSNLRSVELMTANAMAANMLSDTMLICNTITAAGNAIINTLYEVFQSYGGTSVSSISSSGSATISSSINSTQIDSYASGGYVANPTIALIGDAPGGEYIVPAQEYQRLFERQTMNLQIDGSAIQKQIADVVGGITIEPVIIPARVEVDFDSSEIQAAIHRAIAIELESIRI